MAEQEAQVSLLFKNIDAGFAQVNAIEDVAAAESKLREVTDQIKDVKGAVKEYEREARIDGVPAAEIRATKAEMVNLVNKYVAQKKDTASRLANAKRVISPANSPGQAAQALPSPDPPSSSQPSPAQPPRQAQEMTNMEIIGKGRTQIDETDAALARAVRTVAETEDTGAKTAAQLKKQTEQMAGIIDDLNEIDFSMKKAGKVITDITRGLATDKCIMCLLFLVVAAIVVAVGLKIFGIGGDDFKIPSPSSSRDAENETDGIDITAPARKLLMSAAQLWVNI